MAWIIASVPFWMIGGIVAALAIIGLCTQIKKPTMTRVEAVLASSTLLIIAGIFFIVAAKVAGT